jgi:hypothetical protein
MIDAVGPDLLAKGATGPLEQRHLQYANYRAVADGSKVTRTHWHIALANGLRWGFDGMDGVIFALISPLIIKEFALDIPTYRTGFQIWLTFGITGLYFWPWARARRSPPRSSRPAFAALPTVWCGSSASSSDLCCGRSLPWHCNRLRVPFALAFLTIPIFMVAMALGVWLIVSEHAGKELNVIAV